MFFCFILFLIFFCKNIIGDNMCCRCHNIFTWCCRCCPEYTLSIHDAETGSPFSFLLSLLSPFPLPFPLPPPLPLFYYFPGKKCGKIQKKFSGVAKELATSADNYKLKFPEHAGTNDRALLLGSAIFCDYLYFEKPPPVEKHEDNKHKK